MKANVKNAADAEQVKEAEKKVKWTRERELEDIRFILQTSQGRRFVWRYLTLCGVFETSFTGSSETFFKEGQRNVGLKLLADINDAEAEAFVVMMREAKKQESI